MPKHDGIEMLKQLTAQSEFKDIPIIVLTAFGIVERENAIKVGANRAADKPIHIESLMKDINELLDQPNIS